MTQIYLEICDACCPYCGWQILMNQLGAELFGPIKLTNSTPDGHVFYLFEATRIHPQTRKKEIVLHIHGCFVSAFILRTWIWQAIADFTVGPPHKCACKTSKALSAPWTPIAVSTSQSGAPSSSAI